jgi:hypothetical protein
MAALFHDDPKIIGGVLGSDGDGIKQSVAKPGYWGGHLVTIVEDRYLMDTTLDQANVDHPWLGATPIVIDLQTTEWFQPHRFIDLPFTGLLRLFPDVQVRYNEYRHQKGFHSAGDFKPARRRRVVEKLLLTTRAEFVQLPGY